MVEDRFSGESHVVTCPCGEQTGLVNALRCGMGRGAEDTGICLLMQMVLVGSVQCADGLSRLHWHASTTANLLAQSLVHEIACTHWEA